jgi:transcriptional regulator with XRE-family HTH domain
MWKLRGGSQQALARELGVSDALLSAYLTIAKLPDSIKTTFRRLKVGQLTQIARLSREKSKIALAEKCRQEDLSVRQLKAIVDRKLTKDRPSAKAPSQSERKPKDPLEAFWPELSYKEDISSAGLWAVAYGSCTGFAGGKLPGDGWRFWVSNGYGDTPKEQLGKWFKEMAEAFGETPREKKIASPRVEAVRAAANAREREETESFARALMTGEAKIRLPKTPAEQAELEALAAQGPGAVYAWIYGPESIFTKQVQPMTWEQMDVKDPVQGCRDLLKTIGS